MIDSELLGDIRKVILEIGGVYELPGDEAETFCQRLASRYVGDRKQRWWWATLAQPSCVLRYGDRDGLAMLYNLLASKPVIYLGVTDDEEGPWPVIVGDSRTICALLREVRFFEYFVADPDFNWVVFDTHHNELVVVGERVSAAREMVSSSPFRESQ